MKTYRCLRLAALALALFTALGAVCALAAEPAKESVAESPATLIYFKSFGRSRLLPDDQGVFSLQRKDAAAIGEAEHLLVELWASEYADPGETAIVTVSSKGYDFSDCVPLMVVPMDGQYYVKKLPDYTAEESELGVNVRVESMGVNSETPVYLYLAPKKTADGATVKLTLKRRKTTQFQFGQTILLGDYYVKKQGGLTPVEIALGMANMDEDDIVYVVSDAGGCEILRLVVHQGELYGLARSENGLIVSLEYDFAKKAYVSAATGNDMVSKTQVMDVFAQLGISFTNPPDEDDWLWRQKQYSMSRTIRIGGSAAAEDAAEEAPAQTDIADEPPAPEEIAQAEPDEVTEPDEVAEPEEAPEPLEAE